jgi:hypothetical protein
MNDTVLMSYEDQYDTNKEHSLDGSKILEAARNSLESAGASFATDAIVDSDTRQRYMDGIKRISRTVQTEVDSGHISAADGASYCQEMRNRILMEARKITSPQALGYAQYKKADGRSLPWLLDKYSDKLFQKPFSTLTDAEKDRAYYAVIEAAGRDDAKITAATGRLRTVGKVGLLITAALAAHAILTADDKIKEAAKQGTVLQGGVLGGYLAGLAVASICGPGAPFCAIAVVLIGSVMGSLSTEYSFDAYSDETEEYRTWKIQ